jgi:6-phosphogluconate dehydrogenase (decarboxylating)
MAICIVVQTVPAISSKWFTNGIEYGIMAAFSEGLNIIKHANIGRGDRELDAETTPLRNPEFYRYEFDIAQIAEVWRRGSVIGSWLLDLTAEALRENPELSRFAGRVSDSGEGRWTLQAAIDEGVPAQLSAQHYLVGSNREGLRIMPTSCSRQCDMNSAATSRNPRTKRLLE